MTSTGINDTATSDLYCLLLLYTYSRLSHAEVFIRTPNAFLDAYVWTESLGS